MQRRLLSVILFALVAALAASTVLYKLISRSDSATKQAPSTRLWVASRDLVSGATLEDTDLQQVNWPGPISAQWIRQKEDITGRGLIAGIEKGEPFPSSRLALKGAGGGLASRIPPGMRAIAVHIDELNGLSKVILPGMHVDVLSTGALPGRDSQNQVTRTILQNVEVLSTGQSLEHGDKATPVQSANLLVSPRQAEILSQAVAQTRIELALRNPLDKGAVVEAAAIEPKIKPNLLAKTHLFQVPAMPVAAPAAVVEDKPARPTIEVVHGTKRVVTEVGVSPKQESSNE